MNLARCVVGLVAMASMSLGCNQLLGIHDLSEDDGGARAVTTPDASAGADARGASLADGSTAAGCTPGDQRCSPNGLVIQQCDLLGIWRDTTICPYACTGTGTATACTGSCKPGTSSCGPDNTPFLCDSRGTNQPQAACMNTCADGACTGDCKPGTTRCAAGSANMVQACDSTGHWARATSCTFVCDTSTQDCGGECSPGAPNQCLGNTVQACGATGHWAAMSTCTTVPCSGGECRACASSEKQCNSGKPQTCNAAGIWMDDQASPCQFVCVAATGLCSGECVPGTDACTGGSSKHCDVNGTYGTATTCPNVCDASTGRCGGVCAPNTSRCNGSAMQQTCGSNGQWSAGTSCPFGCNSASGQCNACTDEALSTTCAGNKCGATLNNCGHTAPCATTCAGTGESCGGGGVTGVCGCRPEALAQTCQNGARCGNAMNNCGTVVTCPACAGGQECAQAPATPVNACCNRETDAQMCARTGKNCGSVTAADNCGVSRTVNCGTCLQPQVCGTSNVCGCTAETNAAFCTRLGKTCGTVSGIDNCGASRSTSCGSCTALQVCATAAGSLPNTCCTPDSDAAICTRLGKNCNSMTVTDNCGTSRSVNCGACSNQACVSGVCSGMCSTGARRCSGTNLQTCDSNGMFSISMACDDRDACTTNACSNNACTFGPRTTCPAPTNPCQMAPGTCNATSGQCDYPARSGSCDLDTNACTQDTCLNGVCTAGVSRSCLIDECNTGCSPATGNCVPKTNNTTCTSLQYGSCQSGACLCYQNLSVACPIGGRTCLGWSFESRTTEGWGFVSGLTQNATATGLSAATPPQSNGTGTSALSFQYTGAPGGSGEAVVTVPICNPGGVLVDGRTLNFSVYFLNGPGQVLQPLGGQVFSALADTGGSVGIGGVNATQEFAAMTWLHYNMVVQQGDPETAIGIAFFFTQVWAGTIFVDDVRIQ